MAGRQELRTAIVELIGTQNRIIEAQQATISQLEQEVISRGLPDDQVPQANLDEELALVQQQQQNLERLSQEPIEGTSPEGEPVVVQPEPEEEGGGGGGGTETGTPPEGDEGVPSDANTQPPPTDPAAPPTETEGGAVGNRGGGTAPEPMT